MVSTININIQMAYAIGVTMAVVYQNIYEMLDEGKTEEKQISYKELSKRIKFLDEDQVKYQLRTLVKNKYLTCRQGKVRKYTYFYSLTEKGKKFYTEGENI